MLFLHEDKSLVRAVATGLVGPVSTGPLFGAPKFVPVPCRHRSATNDIAKRVADVDIES